MGKIVFGGAMSHVLDPEYYQAACGDIGRQKVVAAMDAIASMGDRFVEKKADALIVVADDHMNAFSFNCVPAICVRIGKTVQRMMQDNAEAFDKVLEHMPTEYPLHEALGNSILEQGVQSGFDLALSWEAPVDHAFLSPVNTMLGKRPIPPLVPIFVNAFIAPQPTARRCFSSGSTSRAWWRRAPGTWASSRQAASRTSPSCSWPALARPTRSSTGSWSTGWKSANTSRCSISRLTSCTRRGATSS